MLYKNFPFVSDDGSVSSTIDVQQLPQPKKALHEEQRCRRVCFQEESNTFIPSFDYEIDEAKHIWYTASEYQDFKKRYISAVRKAIRANKADKPSFIPVMEEVYKNCCAASCCECFVRPSKLHNELNELFDPTLLGLEKVLVNQIRLDKKLRREELIALVVEIQEAKNFDSNMDEAIARAVQEVTLPSRLLARQIAKLVESC